VTGSAQKYAGRTYQHSKGTFPGNGCREITLNPVASAALTNCLIQATPRKISQIALLIWWTVEGKSQDFENKKIRRSGQKQALRRCAASFHGWTSTPTLRRLFSASLIVFCQHGGRPFSDDPANPLRVVCQQGMFVFNGMPEAREYRMGRKPLRLCHSALHAHNVRPVRMYCTVCTAPCPREIRQAPGAW
jgi:hypothetical protein